MVIAELTHMDEDWNGRLEFYQRQECFISANIFQGDDPEPGIVYLTRFVIPIIQTMINKGEVYKKKFPEHLRYIILNVDSLPMNNLMRFIGYWDEFNYFNYTKYSSSLRMELVMKRI